MGLFDPGGQSHNTFHAWYLLYDWEPVLEEEAGFAKFPAQEIAAHKQFVEKETGHYYASFPCNSLRSKRFLASFAQ